MVIIRHISAKHDITKASEMLMLSIPDAFVVLLRNRWSNHLMPVIEVDFTADRVLDIQLYALLVKVVE
jgi:hypothetical protein